MVVSQHDTSCSLCILARLGTKIYAGLKTLTLHTTQKGAVVKLEHSLVDVFTVTIQELL